MRVWTSDTEQTHHLVYIKADTVDLLLAVLPRSMKKFGCSLRVWDENPAACRSGELQPLDSVPGDLERDKKVKETDQWSWCADQYGNICTSSPKCFCSWSSLIQEDRYLNTGPVWWMWISICNTGSLLEFVFVLWEEWMMVKQTTELEH